MRLRHLPTEAGTLEPPLQYELCDLKPPTSARVTAALKGGCFPIATDQPFVKVAWRITGRQQSSQTPNRQKEE